MPTTSNSIKDSVPPSILKRLNALRKLQLEAVNMEAELFNETFRLEQQFTERLKPLLEKRNAIVNGQYEPTEEESQCPIELPEECLVDAMKTSSSWLSGGGDSTQPVLGIPNFWLQVLKNATPVASLIQEYDEPVLEYLSNISLEFGQEQDDLKSFTLVFEFKPNKYFKNERLTKTYQVRVSPCEDDPFSFEGPEIVGCTGCQIDWFPNMNVTRRMVRRRKTNKSDGKVSVKSESIPRDSFFHFFIPPTLPTCADESTDELDELLEEHYEVGHFMREKLIPNAVLLYTGESPDAESDFDEDDEDEDEEDDDDQANSGSNDDVGNEDDRSGINVSSDYSDDGGYSADRPASGSDAPRGHRFRHMPG